MEESSGIFVGRYQEQSYVTRGQDGYEWHRTDGTRCGFNEDGFLTRIEDPSWEKGTDLFFAKMLIKGHLTQL